MPAKPSDSAVKLTRPPARAPQPVSGVPPASGDESRQAPDQAPREPLNEYVCQRVREMRKQRSWTLQALSTQSGVSRSMLSQIERGTANPTLGVAFRIAQAFGITLGDLVEGHVAAPQIDVVRRTDPRSLFRDDDQCRIRTLSPLQLEKDVEFYELTLKPKGALVSAPHFEGTREFLTIQKGTVRILSADTSDELRKGDSAQYPADVPHRVENVGRGEAVGFLVVIYANTASR